MRNEESETKISENLLLGNRRIETVFNQDNK